MRERAVQKSLDLIGTDVGNQSFAYSAGGKFTDESKALYKNCHTLVHDSYNYIDEHSGHENAVNVCAFAKREIKSLQKLLLVHISKFAFMRYKEELLKLGEKYPFKINIPIPAYKREPS